MKRISISNCNCISHADIDIQENAINIKYAGNGTGKTTISKAIFAESTGNKDALNLLKPYGISDDSIVPNVSELPFERIMVFDESYVSSYLFVGDEFFSDSFGVFLKSRECDELSEQIEVLLKELQSVFYNKNDIQSLRQFLPSYLSAVNYSDGSIKRRGGIGEFIKGNGAGFEKYRELDDYKTFYSGREMAAVSKWAKWRHDGIDQIHGDKCPFCAKPVEQQLSEQNKVISKVFKNSALKTANDVLAYLEEAAQKGYIEAESMQKIERYIGNSNKADELCFELQTIANETEYLIKKMEKICSFRPMNVTHDQLINIEACLSEMVIDKDKLRDYYNTETIQNIINLVNTNIDALTNKTNQLKGLFFKHESKLNKLIESREDDINYFFALAGFPYEFKLKQNGENKALAYLAPVGLSDEKVSKPKERLSWGERNAFALVMFMFEAISVDADFIVLDDPISAFDEHKKYAIFRRMFDTKKASFRGKTVLMLTHDMQPIIDYIHGKAFKNSVAIPVYGYFLQNSNGIIIEKPIKKENLKNSIELSKSIACDNSMSLAARVVNMRKYIEITSSSYDEKMSYQLLSNAIHGRNKPIFKNGEELSVAQVREGIKEINTCISSESYSELIEALADDVLIRLIEFGNQYEKIIAIRLLFERNDSEFKTLRRMYPAACKYINETNHIENDYIFQLDPREYFSIPEVYINELDDFISKNFQLDL